MMSTIWPFAAGFAIATIVVPLLISWQQRRRLGQQIYEDGPKAHAVKQGTPTMGGVAFIVAAAAGALFSHNGVDARLLVLAAGAGAIGLADDALILIRRRALGLKARWKMALLAFVGALFLWMLQTGPAPLGYAESWFGQLVVLPPPVWWTLAMLAILGAANAVNLTDGVDGLATGTVIAPLTLFALASLSSLAVAVLGACVAFFYFNRYPAKIFMGDAGSLLLGALLAGCAIVSGRLFYLPFVGIVFVIEALSVIAQVASFKLTGKRVLKMSPLHHHFELSGWSERRITWTFTVVSIVATLVFGAASLATYAAIREALPGLAPGT